MPEQNRIHLITIASYLLAALSSCLLDYSLVHVLAMVPGVVVAPVFYAYAKKELEDLALV